jgi:8-amino-3,8-dideoxy-alpha-D-manno-octulosonate transaminase
MEGRTILGFNYRMNELQGAIGLAQLRKLDRVIAGQRANKATIKAMLAGVRGVGFRELPDADGDTATFLAFNLPTEDMAARFQKALAAGGVDTTCFKFNKWHYVPNWEHFLAQATANAKQYPFKDPSYTGKASYGREGIPRAEDLLGRTLVMGISVRMAKERLDRIGEAIAQAARTL